MPRLTTASPSRCAPTPSVAAAPSFSPDATGSPAGSPSPSAVSGRSSPAISTEGTTSGRRPRSQPTASNAGSAHLAPYGPLDGSVTNRPVSRWSRKSLTPSA